MTEQSWLIRCPHSLQEDGRSMNLHLVGRLVDGEAITVAATSLLCWPPSQHE